MASSILLTVAVLIFLTIVAPIWIVAHYVTRWRLAKTLSPQDERRLAELARTADRLEERIRNLERILDTESPDWRRSQP